MGLFRPLRDDVRSISGEAFIHGYTMPGSPASMSSALSVVPVFAAVRLIVDSITTLPMQAFTKSGDARTPRPLPAVFDLPDRIEWLQQPLMSMLLRGNAYGLITSTASAGWPQAVSWLNPEKVEVDESYAVPRYFYKGRPIDPHELIHIPAYVLPGSTCGLSPIKACSMLADTGLATQRMMRDWFNGKAIPSSTFQNTDVVLDQTEAQIISDGLQARLRNGKPLVYGKDWKFDAVQMTAEDAAFLAAARLNATQIATIYGIPPHMIGGEESGSLTYSTVELNQLSFLTNTLRPWIAKLEAEFSSWLPRPQFVKFNIDALLRVDTKTRYEVHQIARTIGLNNIDELRAVEDEAPLPDGQGQDYAPLSGAAPLPKPGAGA